MRILHTCVEPSPFDEIFSQAGFASVHLSFLQHKSLGNPCPSSSPELVLISSARTVEHARGLREWVRGETKVLAIGRKTAKALCKAQIDVAHVAEGTGPSLVNAIRLFPCESFWHVGAQELSQPLEQALKNQSKTYRRWKVYSSGPIPELAARVRALPPYALTTLASPRVARLFAQHGEGPVVCIGPSTAAQAEESNLAVLGVAATPSKESLAQLAVRILQRR